MGDVAEFVGYRQGGDAGCLGGADDDYQLAAEQLHGGLLERLEAGGCGIPVAWHSSPVAALYTTKVFENKKKSGGYWF